MIQDTVRLGVAEDYAASLLPPILEQFGGDYPGTTVELVCEPSISLSVAVKKGNIDMAVVTRSHDQPRYRGASRWHGSPRHAAQRSPLPVALFQTCSARVNIVKSLTQAERRYHCTYSSAGLAGMTAIMQAGLAVADLALCSVPPTLTIVGEKQGLSPIDELQIGILRTATVEKPAANRLGETFRRGFRQVEPGRASYLLADAAVDIRS